MEESLEESVEQESIAPVHSFDLWGTLVVQETLGPRVVDAYQRLMEGKEEPSRLEQNVDNYRAILEGNKEALKRKKEYVDAVEEPLWKAYQAGEIDVDFQGAFYEDALSAMGNIAEADQEICIITTGKSPWVQQAVASVSPEVAGKMVDVYSGDKSKKEVYERAAADLEVRGKKMVSHTEDQMKGFEGILQSPLQEEVELVYVERANLATAEEVKARRIDQYTRDLGSIDYLALTGEAA